MLLGSHVLIDGNRYRINRVATSAKKKGTDPRNTRSRGFLVAPLNT
jgi:hypothetical protein